MELKGCQGEEVDRDDVGIRRRSIVISAECEVQSFSSEGGGMARELEAAGTWTLTFASEPRPYMPNNPDPDERAKTIVCARFIVA